MRLKSSFVIASLATLVALSPTVALALISGVTVDKDADLSLNETVAEVTGAVQCTALDTVQVSVLVIQAHGRAILQGFGNGTLVCTGGVDQWAVLAPISLGSSFASGPGTVSVSVFDTTDGDFQTVSTAIHLKK